ncbi:glutathione S-transferase family protein [Roseibium aggregatum]|uniref:Glutathione S-transferase family protein n=1 Tax=Roseibium aggregatum TaxID=187304 RepID=A0A926NTB8_9HYPH|nr:glutathione S-transferase family protein [Roseibium aggregatum]MBD1547032.1 glutathione S-transferase family protein [Roseibium aggregatum]
MSDPFKPDPDRLCLYGSFDSANLVVRFVLEELGLDYRFIAVDRAVRANKTPEFLKLNPQGLLPVLADPDLSEPVFETAAIILYLADKAQGLAPPFTSPERGRLLTWLFYLSNTLHADLRISFRPERYVADEAARWHLISGLEGRLIQAFDQLESAFERSGGLYVLGAEPSIVDFYAATCARWYQLYPEPKAFNRSAWPRLTAMIAKLQTRPAVIRAREMEQIPGPAFLDPQRPAIDPAALTGI